MFKTLEAARIRDDWERDYHKVQRAIDHLFLETRDISVDQAHSILISSSLLVDDLRALANLIELRTNNLTDRLMDATDKLSRGG
jgi:hypothetical protein